MGLEEVYSKLVSHQGRHVILYCYINYLLRPLFFSDLQRF
ncbi:hypothetical protein PITC_017590 [Penicillium italicum]|uniref:Uncharacterized protein n=1 Tax=Penicillium italicum TaxID=40296 RepID=A0A0A2KMP6_PENIT|nr:hypothetical protein PITC_017590 [Penicillium italicum]